MSEFHFVTKVEKLTPTGLWLVDRDIRGRLVNRRFEPFNLMGGSPTDPTDPTDPTPVPVEDNWAEVRVLNGLSAGDFVWFEERADGVVARKADQNLKRPAYGFVREDWSADSLAKVYLSGVNEHVVGAIKVNKTYFLSSGNEVVPNLSPNSNTYQKIGLCVGFNKLRFIRHTPITKM